MPEIPSVFPLWHISLTALIAFVASIVLLRTWGSHFGMPDVREVFWVALVVGLSVLAWRLAGNVPQLNDDPVPAFSPNDVLCPVVTYVLLGVYAGFRPPADQARWEQARATLTIVSLFVNVITI